MSPSVIMLHEISLRKTLEMNQPKETQTVLLKETSDPQEGTVNPATEITKDRMTGLTSQREMFTTTIVVVIIATKTATAPKTAGIKGL